MSFLGLGQSEYEKRIREEWRVAEENDPLRLRYGEGTIPDPVAAGTISVSGPYQYQPTTWRDWHQKSRPPLPEDAADCDAYSRLMCEHDVSVRKVPASQAPGCRGASVAERCRELVAQVLTQTERAVAAHQTELTEQEVAALIKQVGDAPGAEVIRRVSPEPVQAAILAGELAERRRALLRSGLRVLGYGALALGAWVGWRIYQRRAAR